MNLRILTYNVHGAAGYHVTRNPHHLIDCLRPIDADLIALQELADYEDPLSTRIQTLRFIGDALGMHPLPGFTTSNELGPYGNGLLSRYPFDQSEKVDLSFAQREPRLALSATIAPLGYSIRFIATHLGLRRDERWHQLGLLRGMIEASDIPTVLLGDLNEWRPRSRPLRSVFPAAPLGRLSRRTFPARLPLFPVDRIIVRPPHWLKGVSAISNRMTRRLSDHLPLVATLSLPEHHSSADRH